MTNLDDIYNNRINNSELSESNRQIAHVLFPILRQVCLDILKFEVDNELDTSVREMERILKIRFPTNDNDDQTVPTNDDDDQTDLTLTDHENNDALLDMLNSQSETELMLSTPPGTPGRDSESSVTSVIPESSVRPVTRVSNQVLTEASEACHTTRGWKAPRVSLTPGDVSLNDESHWRRRDHRGLYRRERSR